MHNDIGGVILQSPMASIFRVIFRLRFSLPFDKFQNIEMIKSVTSPVLVIHGLLDEIVPFDHGRALFEAARTPVTPLWLMESGHNDIEAIGPNLWDTLNRFMDTVQTGRCPKVQ
eukprot:GHVO01032740.1.p1 GENE.GHVO01032740.1~~GHVO01032740.1.p1  ORF type:complete len:130 (+),score=27.01 GHVO01032740.1:49-390(+)